MGSGLLALAAAVAVALVLVAAPVRAQVNGTNTSAANVTSANATNATGGVSAANGTASTNGTNATSALNSTASTNATMPSNATLLSNGTSAANSTNVTSALNGTGAAGNATAAPPAPPPGPLLPDNSLAAELTLAGNFTALNLGEGTANRSHFEARFKESVALTLGVNSTRVVIISVQPGSVIVRFAIVPDPVTGTSFPAAPLQAAFAAAGVTIAGLTTRCAPAVFPSLSWPCLPRPATPEC